ncbi:MAG: hypothetical protein GXY44_02250 [Phycisphaerales bacterium]|nr:hypothetical protein [Phycisphaerales bacterium]
MARGLSVSQAAAALLAELQGGYPGVSSATLGGDGTTIFLTMSDGAVSMLNTNNQPFTDDGTPSQAARTTLAGEGLYKTIGHATARIMTTTPPCTDQITPATRKVLIINTAAISHPGTQQYVQEIKDALIAEGWLPTDIDVRSRAGSDDRAFLPDSMTRAVGYGLVFIIAHGCLADPGDGVQHAFIQCCRTGGVTEVLQPEQWAILMDERNKARLIRCQTPAENGGFVKDIYARDDYLIEQMAVGDEALVYFIAPHSWSVANGIAEQGAGSSLGWEGAFHGNDGQRAVLGMIRRMTADNTWTTDVQAFENLLASGLGTSQAPDDQTTTAKLTDIAGAFYLPAWGHFTVDPDNFPEKAVQADVSISYADCPGTAIDFTINANESMDMEYLSAGEATVTVQALNNAGDIIGSGLHKIPVNGGQNDLQLATCEGTAKIRLFEYPEEGRDAATRIYIEFVYPFDFEDAPDPVDLRVTEVAQWSELVPAGKITVHATALNASGQSVGEYSRDAEIECDISPIELCFGWIKLKASNVTANTTSVRVTSDSPRVPGPYEFPAGGSMEIYGAKIDEVIHFAMEELDNSGHAVSSTTKTVTVACGQNVVDLDLANYGILMGAEPSEIAADGLETSLITATLRYWKAGDTLVPTGDPVAGKSVQFSTSLGTLSGINPVVTNANGQATILLSSTQGGVATVRAFVQADQKQGSISVTFGSAGSDMTLNLKWAPTFAGTTATSGVCEAGVRNKDGTPAAGVPVHFALVAGGVELLGALDTVTSGSGTAAIQVRSNVPAFGLIEATVPGTSLVKRRLTFFGLKVIVSPSVSSLLIDKDEVLLTASASPDPASVGLPVQCDWFLQSGTSRPIRNGTAAAYARYDFLEIPNTIQAKVSRGVEPDTSCIISAELSYYVDGELSEGVSWTGSVAPATIQFHGKGKTVGIEFDSTQRELPDTNPKLYATTVKAYFPLDGPDGKVRCIVNNSKDDGQTAVPPGWQDGTNTLLDSCATCVFTVASDSSNATENPGAWIAERMQKYQEDYGHLTITAYFP